MAVAVAVVAMVEEGEDVVEADAVEVTAARTQHLSAMVAVGRDDPSTQDSHTPSILDLGRGS